jgi:hypothetical protein
MTMEKHYKISGHETYKLTKECPRMPHKRRVTILGSKQKTMTRSNLIRLAFCNSKKLPLVVNDGGVRKEWVGIGWIASGKLRGDEVLVIDK